MKELKFKDVRFDPDITPFHALALQMANAFGYTSDLTTDKKLAQILRVRVAQSNECAFCTVLHAQTSRDAGVSAAKTDNLSSWWNSELYSDKEKAALSYCDALTEGKTRDFQKYHDAMTEFFSVEEIAEIAAIVINMNLWTRMKLAQGATPYMG